MSTPAASAKEINRCKPEPLPAGTGWIEHAVPVVPTS
jgi:hypothetical protein